MALSNAQYDSIMRTYEATRRLHKKTQREHAREISETLPAYRALEEEIGTLVNATAQNAIRNAAGEGAGSADDFLSLHERLREIRSAKKDLLLTAGYPADYLELEYTCGECMDTGYVGEKRCRCFEEKARDLLYRQSNLYTLIERNNFSLLSEEYYDGNDLKLFRAAVEICRRFIDGFGTPDGYGNILFFGTVGSGKSFLSVCTANEILKKGFSVLYFSAGELFDRLAEVSFGYDNKEALTELRNDLHACDLLIIDDLGAELTNAFVSSQLFTCINERELMRHSTIISTNLKPEELRARYSDRVFSRLASAYTICEINAKDVRLMRKAR